MPSLTRVGGGIYWAIGLSFAAWALREGHEYLSRLRNDREDKTQLGRWHAPMSAALVKLLVGEDCKHGEFPWCESFRPVACIRLQ